MNTTTFMGKRNSRVLSFLISILLVASLFAAAPPGEAYAADVAAAVEDGEILITDTAIEGIAPVAGEEPVSGNALDTDYYESTVTWSGILTSDGVFAPSTTYTAIITLSAVGGYVFGDGTSNTAITVDAAAPVTVTAISTTQAAVEAYFDETAATITQTAIPGVDAPVSNETPVTEINATQYTGDVKWEDEDGNSAGSVFEPLTTYSAIITLEAIEGRTLYGVTKGAFTVTDATITAPNTTNGGVLKAIFPKTGVATIGAITVGGVTAPIAGETPVTGITDTDKYTGTVTWSGILTADGKFAPSTTYSAIITLSAIEGYVFDASDAIGVDDAVTVTPFALTTTQTSIAALFPKTAATITQTAIPGVDAPVSNETPVTEINTTQYTGEVAWKDDGGDLVGSVFEPLTTYSAIITLEAIEGYTLFGVSAGAFTVAGATITAPNTTDAGILTAEFPKTGIATVSAITVGGVTAPVAGEAPVTTIGATQYTGDVNWEDDTGNLLSAGAVFDASTTYTAIITLEAKDGYVFNNPGISVDGSDDVTVSAISTTQASIKAVFPKTDDTITELVIPGVTAPVAGDDPVTTIAATQYDGTVTWSGLTSDGKFAPGVTPEAIITLAPKTGYTTYGVAEDAFTVTDAAATNPTDSGIVTAVFPKTDETVTITTIPGVTAPVKGATPVTATAVTDEYTGTVTWTPTPTPSGVFNVSTTYTAIITLTPEPGYTLYGVPANFFTVEGATTVTNTTDGGIVNAEFPPTAAAETVTISTIPGVIAPSTGYQPVTEITDTDEYTGTVTWSPTPSGVFDPITTYTAIIELTPKVGFTLTGVPANFFTVDGATSVANTTDSGIVTAAFPTTEALKTVTISAIPGVTAPVTGATPTAITETTQYEGTVTWSPTPSGVFDPSTTYEATITLTAKPGYTFTGLGVDFFGVEDAVSVANTTGSSVVIVTAAFPETEPLPVPPVTVTISAIPGVTAPVAGEAPVPAITATDQYTGTVTWTPTPSGNFAAGTTYTAIITLSPKSGYTLTGVPANFFTVEGASIVVPNTTDGGIVHAEFPATAPPAPDVPVNIDAIPGVTAPVTGATPVSAITATDQYTGVVAWSPAPVGGKFAARTTYKATITLSAKSGFTFTGVAANFFRVAGATTVTNPANSGVVEATFSATAPIPDPTKPVTGVTIDPAGSATFKYKVSGSKTVQLTAVVAPADATNKAVTWSSSNEKIATVNASGLVTFKGPEGNVTITVTSSADTSKSGTKVFKVVKNVKVNTPLSKIYIQKGKSLQLTAIAQDSSVSPARVVSAKLTWSSSKKSALTVSKSGKIKASKKIKKKTKVTVTVKAANGSYKKITVYVVPKATKLKALKVTAPKSLKVKKTKQLKVNTGTATGIKVTFKSSKPSVLRVDKAGKLFALKKGKATITIKAGGKTVKKTITVKK